MNLRTISVIVGAIASVVALFHPGLDADELSGTANTFIIGGLALAAGVKLVLAEIARARSTKWRKPMIQSREWWLGVGVVVVGIVRLIGFEVDDANAHLIVNQLYDGITSLLMSGAGAAVMIERAKRARKVQTRKPELVK